MNSLSAHLFPNARDRQQQQPERATNSRSMARSRGESMNGESRGGAKRPNGQSSGTGTQLFGTSQHHGQANKPIRDNGPALSVASPYGNSVPTSNQTTTTNGKRAPNFKNIESIELQGQFRLRKVFTLRNKLQPDVDYGAAGRAAPGGGAHLPPPP